MRGLTRRVPDAVIRWATVAALVTGALVVPRVSNGEEGLPPIEQVEIGPNREFRVNGAPFVPIMIWLQPAENFEVARRCGINSVAGYWPGSSDTEDVVEYIDLVEQSKLYGVMPFDERLIGNPNVLGYIHGDEPDLPRQQSDAEVIPAEHLKLNSSTPLWKLVDGVTHSWSVLDPLDGAEVTIRPPEPVSVAELGVHLTISSGLSVAKEIIWSSGDRELARQSLEPEKGLQSIRLPEPVEVDQLTLRVAEVVPGENVWGSLGEVVALDTSGENVIESPPYWVPRAEPEAVQEEYRRIKAGGADRPVFVTFTGYFHPHFGKWDAAQRERLYPAYIDAADVVGYDIYPIYGWNKPEWIELVYEATGLLSDLAKPRPVYAWIETSKGGQYTGSLDRQKDVTGRHIRAEVWMALCNGATAIGYFTHIWKPGYKPFGVPAENQRALAEINAQITRLTEAITAAGVSGVSAKARDDTRVAVRATETAAAWYIFAVNCDHRDRPAEVRFELPEEMSLPDGTGIEVVDESRQLTLSDGGFADDFEGLAVHIYRVEKPHR